MREFDYTYLSLGAGVQSTAVLVMSALGLHNCPKADVAIFADTGDEPPWIYEYLEHLKTWGDDHDLPVHVVQHGVLSKDTFDPEKGGKTNFVSIPAWTQGKDGRETLLRRQCTREYKITPIYKHVRKLLGYKPRQRIKEQVLSLIGISLDEVSRAKPSRERWITNDYPLINSRLVRNQCYKIIADHGLPRPRKSSCTFCPFHDNAFWQDIKDNHPIEFAKACSFDKKIRTMSKNGEDIFIHRSLQPLVDVAFKDPNQPDLFDGFDNECEGHCGV